MELVSVNAYRYPEGQNVRSRPRRLRAEQSSESVRKIGKPKAVAVRNMRIVVPGWQLAK
jgi:hypothetical protein